MFFTAAGLSLSKIMRGSNPAWRQNLSHIQRSCLEPMRLIKPSFSTSVRFIFPFCKTVLGGTARIFFYKLKAVFGIEISSLLTLSVVTEMS